MLRLLKVSQEIQKRTDHVIKCFLQVNISGEESKHGFSKEELLELLPELAKLDQIEVCWFNDHGSFEADSDELKEFSRIRRLCKQKLEKTNP